MAHDVRDAHADAYHDEREDDRRVIERPRHGVTACGCTPSGSLRHTRRARARARRRMYIYEAARLAQRHALRLKVVHEAEGTDSKYVLIRPDTAAVVLGGPGTTDAAVVRFLRDMDAPSTPRHACAPPHAVGAVARHGHARARLSSGRVDGTPRADRRRH